jgi:hypothetical protein
MTTFDPIPTIEQLGYTPRESAFIYLAARNSGYFLARQFNWFLRRKSGALTQSFIDKLRDREHAAVIGYGQARFVYHLKSKTIYRLLGIENSQNRRIKGDHEIRLRLMILDYLLEHLDMRILSTEPEKLEFFLAQTNITTAAIPTTIFQPSSGSGEPTHRYFTDRFPIVIAPNQVECAYFDEGEFTTKSFVSYLDRYRSLLTKLAAFQISYVALNPTNFSGAQKAFNRVFPSGPQDKHLLPFGQEHLARFFQAQQLWDENSSDFQPDHLKVLREGESVYTNVEHQELRMEWLAGRQSFDKKLTELTRGTDSAAVFKTCLLDQSYPIFGFKNSGNWQGNQDSVLDSAVGSI